MGTYHSFVSEPLSKYGADLLLSDISKVIEESDYINKIEKFQILQIGSFYIVVGIYKNLGNLPTELIKLQTTFSWVTVSDEGDFYSSKY